jgi:hypothetical protein
LLQHFGPPACYPDFEAMMPPVPLYEGTRPYQTTPFQWSLHMIDGDVALNDSNKRAAPSLIHQETINCFTRRSAESVSGA